LTGAAGGVAVGVRVGGRDIDPVEEGVAVAVLVGVLLGVDKLHPKGGRLWDILSKVQLSRCGGDTCNLREGIPCDRLNLIRSFL